MANEVHDMAIGEQLAVQRKYVVPEELVFDVMVMLSLQEECKVFSAGSPWCYMPEAVWSFLADLVQSQELEVQRRLAQRISDVGLGKIGDYRR